MYVCMHAYMVCFVLVILLIGFGGKNVMIYFWI